MNQKRITNQILNQTNYTLNSTLNYLFNISNMKKLFSYLLISSMVVLSSCTNYDDQFDDLNTQINTLKTQIEGFSSLSSGLTALQGTVASLQTAIANIPVTPATDISGLESTQAALQAGLTSLADAVAALQTKLEGAATAAEVAALQTALAAAQSDLTDLLASNNIYAPTGGTLTINSQSTLDFATALADKVAIINGSVVITQNTSMDATQLAALMAKMVSVTGDASYTAKATGVVPTAGFTALTGVATITIDVDGDVSLPVLASASVVDIKDNTKVTSVSLPALKTVTTLSNLTFAKATSLDLSSLERYADDLVISIKSGKVNLDAFVTTTTTASAPESGHLIHIDGAEEVVAPLITGGKLLMDSVLAPNFPVWKGNSDSIFDEATTVVLPGIEANGSKDAYNLIDFAPDAVKFHMIGASKATSTTTTAIPSFTSVGQNNLETLILDGVLDTVTINGATDLTSVTHTGTAVNVTYKSTGLTSLDLGYTAGTSGATNAAAINGGLTIELNADLTSLTADKLDDITSLTIKNNVELASISMAALNSVGTATAAKVDIQLNDFTVESIQLPSASGALPVVAKTIKSADLGPLKTYIEAAKAKVGTTGSIIVVADTVTEKLNADGTAATVVPGDKTIANFLNAAARTSNMVGGTAQVKEFWLQDNSDNNYQFTVNGFTSVIANGPSALAYDLAEWASTASVVAGLNAAGVSVTTGASPYKGKISLTAISTTVLASPITYAVSVNGKTYSTTINGPFNNSAANKTAIMAALETEIRGNVDVTNAHFAVTATAADLDFASVAVGSASKAYPIGKVTAYNGTSTAATPTLATSTANPWLRDNSSGYIRVVNNTAGLVAAGIANADVLGGTVSATVLVSEGYSVSPVSGDNENVVAAKDGTAQTNAQAILDASVYEADHLAS